MPLFARPCGRGFRRGFQYIFEPTVLFKKPNRTALKVKPKKEAAVKDYILKIMTKKIAVQVRDSW